MAFKPDRAAAVLADAAYLGDAQAAKRWNVALRTVANYRARLKTDPEFARFFQEVRQSAEGDWTSELSRALKTGVRKLACMLDQTTALDPDTMQAVTAAIKALAEIAITREVLDVGNAQPRTGIPTQGQPMAARPTNN